MVKAVDLSPSDLRHLQHAQGYLELGMLVEANEALDDITAELRTHPDVLFMRLQIHEVAKKWPLCVEIARHLAKVQPERPAWPLKLATAIRRAVSVEAARVVLLEAEKRFPDNAIIKLNLGCYEAQIGEPEKAYACVQQAIALDRSLQKDALDDPDLEPIWEMLRRKATES
jgi:lipopolysaccharide biosynthesis regulator YciM